MAYLHALWRGGGYGHVNKSPGYRLQFTYDQDTVEALKAAVPHICREWHEETKTWWVQEGFELKLEKLFSNFHALAFDQRRMEL